MNLSISYAELGPTIWFLLGGQSAGYWIWSPSTGWVMSDPLLLADLEYTTLEERLALSAAFSQIGRRDPDG